MGPGCRESRRRSLFSGSSFVQAAEQPLFALGRLPVEGPVVVIVVGELPRLAVLPAHLAVRRERVDERLALHLRRVVEEVDGHPDRGVVALYRVLSGVPEPDALRYKPRLVVRLNVAARFHREIPDAPFEDVVAVLEVPLTADEPAERGKRRGSLLHLSTLSRRHVPGDGRRRDGRQKKFGKVPVNLRNGGNNRLPETQLY